MCSSQKDINSFLYTALCWGVDLICNANLQSPLSEKLVKHTVLLNNVLCWENKEQIRKENMVNTDPSKSIFLNCSI